MARQDEKKKKKTLRQGLKTPGTANAPAVTGKARVPYQMSPAEVAERKSLTEYQNRKDFSSLLEARGANDPIVRQMAEQGGFKLPEIPTYEGVTGRITAEGGIKSGIRANDLAQKKLDLERRKFEALNPSATKEKTKTLTTDKITALTSVGGVQEQATAQQPLDKVYKGTIHRGGHKGYAGQDFKYFTDNPGASPQGLRGELSEFKTHRLSPPMQAPITGPSPDRIQTADTMPGKMLANKTVGPNQQIGQAPPPISNIPIKAAIQSLDPNRAADWTKHVPLSPKNLQNMGEAILSPIKNIFTPKEGASFNTDPGGYIANKLSGVGNQPVAAAELPPQQPPPNMPPVPDIDSAYTGPPERTKAQLKMKQQIQEILRKMMETGR